tara:strand:+ start:127 stop:489 length:363 start_codon:yes stop_codon:yes gene_type:complete
MNKVNFDTMDIAYHEWFANIVGVWCYKEGKRCSLGPFSTLNHPKSGRYMFHCSDTDSIYILADTVMDAVVITYTWCDGHTQLCEALYLQVEELNEGEEFVHSMLWHLVRKSQSFYKAEVA